MAYFSPAPSTAKPYDPKAPLNTGKVSTDYPHVQIAPADKQSLTFKLMDKRRGQALEPNPR